MKNWMRRFGILTVLGALVCGALVAGCGGSNPEDEGASNTANNTTAPADNADQE
jgi:hypothetical protein